MPRPYDAENNVNAAQSQTPTGSSPRESSALINEAVVEQHAEEAAFLWTMRDRAVCQPNYLLKELSDLDERLEAHLDGLRVAGQFGWQLCEKALEREEPGSLFAAGVLAFESGDTGRIGKVLDTGCLALQLERELTSALGWLPFSKVERRLQELLGSEYSDIRCLAIAAFAAHRRDPGDLLVQALSDPNSRLRARALKACGELGKSDLLSAILRVRGDEDEACRFFAAWSAARLGDRSPQVLNMLHEIATGHGNYAERALGVALRIMDLPQAKAWRQQLRREDAGLRTAVIVDGIIGDPETVTDLIDLVKIPTIARLAGQSFSKITGADLAYENLSGHKPESFEAGPNEDPGDENVAMDPDENLPWPAPVLLTKWWNQHRAKFQMGRRYLRGKEVTIQGLREVLIEGNQHDRAASALELAIKEPTQPLFEVRARGALQLEELKGGCRE